MAENVGIVYALAAAVIWGLVYVLEQKLLEKTNVVPLIFLQSVILTILFIPMIAFRRDFTTVLADGRILVLLVAVAVLTLTAQYFILSGVKYSGAAKASVFEITYPIFVTLFAFTALGQRFTWPFIFGTILIIMGSIIILQYGY